MSVCLIDTSIFTNVLDVPGRNQVREDVLRQLRQKTVQEFTSLLLPAAVIFETGNHIAYLDNGQQRRALALTFIDQVRRSFDGKSPWVPTAVPDRPAILAWLDDFPEHAMTGKSFADHSIVKEWKRQCAMHQARRVYIWSLDGHLQGYDRSAEF